MIQPTKKKPESRWQAKGYEFYHCKCGHRYFEKGMALRGVSEIGPCIWCKEEAAQAKNGAYD